MRAQRPAIHDDCSHRVSVDYSTRSRRARRCGQKTGGCWQITGGCLVRSKAACWVFPLVNPAKRTVLFDLHQKLGARMTVFGGFEMPVSYSGIIEEHLAVRNSAGIFDLSHMGEFELSGPHALETIERAFTNSAARLKPG